MKARNLAAHTVFNFLNIFVTSVQGILVSVILARKLAPDLMGTYSLVLYLNSLCGYLINLGFVTTTMRFMAEALGQDDREEAAAVLSHSVRVLLVNGLLLSLGWVLLAPGFGILYHDRSLPLSLWISGLGLLPFAMIQLLTAACQGLQRYDQVALNTAVTAPLAIGGILFACQWGVPAVFLALSLVYFVGMALYLIFLFRWHPGWTRLKPSPETRRKMWSYSFPILGMLLLDAVVWQRSGVFFLGFFSPAKEIAFYSLAFGLATMAMRLVPGTLIGLLIPSMSRSHGAGNLDGIGKIFRKSCQWMAILAFPVGFAGAILAPKVIQLLYGKEYLPAASSLVVLLASGAVVMTYGFPASSVLYSADGEKTLLGIGLRVAVVNVLLALLLIPFAGALGAAIANSLSQMASIVPGLRAVHKKLGTRPPFRILPKVTLASVAMSVPIVLVSLRLPPLQALASALVLGMPVYFLALLLSKAFDEMDLQMASELTKSLPGKKLWHTILEWAK